MTDSREDEDQRPSPTEIKQAMATWDTDGQNDPTDNDAGQEVPAAATPPSTTGTTGPH